MQFDNASDLHQSAFLRWWYRLTTPREGDLSAVFARERSRKATLISGMTGILMVILGVIFPITFFIPNKYVLLLIGLLFGLCCLALLFNRRGRITFAGSIIITMLEVALLLIIGTTQPFATLNTRLFDFLILPVIFATAFSSARAAFTIVALNSLFIFLVIRFQLPTREFSTLISAPSQFYNVLMLPICLEWITAILFYRAFHNEKQAIIRADRAEVIVHLEQEKAEESRKLEEEIQAIMRVQVAVANGQLESRIDTTKHQKLYELAHSLNQMLTRLQRSMTSAKQLQIAQEKFPKMVNILQQAADQNVPIPELPLTQTFIDPLFRWLVGKRLVSDGRHSPPSSLQYDQKQFPKQ